MALEPVDRAVTAPSGPHTNGHRPAPEPDDFWSERPVLTHLRCAALARRVCPWAVLGVSLVRVVAAIPPFVTLPPLVGGKGSLNLFIALVGAPGGGKGGAHTVAVDTLRTAGVGAPFTTKTLGSGQGIAHAYAQRDKDGQITRHTDSVVFVAEEIDAVGATTKQTGSTLLPEIRSLWMGEPLGKMYVDKDKRIEIAAHSYRAGLIAHVQPERAGTLLDDAAGGTPQRFLWLPTTWPHADIKPAGPASMWPWRPPLLDDDGRSPGVTLPVCPVAADEIDASALARARGEGDPLDGHKLFCQLKVAAAMAVLDGRAEVADLDWHLARHIMAISHHTRGQVLDDLQAVKVRAHADKAYGAALSAVAVDDALTDAAVKRVCKALPKHVPLAPDCIGRTKLRNRVAARDRQFFDEALSRLQSAGVLIITETARGSTMHRPKEAR